MTKEDFDRLELFRLLLRAAEEAAARDDMPAARVSLQSALRVLEGTDVRTERRGNPEDSELADAVHREMAVDQDNGNA
jgi:hypothetical protein